MTSAYEQNRLNLNTTRFNDPTRVQQQLETGKNIVKQLTSPENIQEQLFEMAIDSSIFLKSDNPLSAIRTIAARRAGKFILDKADIPARVATNYNDLRRLSNIGEEVTRKTGIENVARDSGVVQFINQDPNILDSLTKGSNSYNKINEIKARYPNRQIYDFKPKGVEKEKFVQEHLAIKAKGGNIPYFLEKGRLKYLDLKASNYRGTGQPRYNFVDLQNKLANEATRRALKLEKSIPIEDYIIELGKEQGTKAFNFNKAKMKKLYRWVSEEGAHLDHMWPLVSTKTEGFHHINNLILLYAKDNLKKSNKVLPKALFEELGIPLSKRDLIRSTLQKPKTTNKIKRQKILEALGILETK